MFIFIILFSVVIGHHFLLLFEIVELMQSSMKVFFYCKYSEMHVKIFSHFNSSFHLFHLIWSNNEIKMMQLVSCVNFCAWTFIINILMYPIKEYKYQ